MLDLRPPPGLLIAILAFGCVPAHGQVVKGGPGNEIKAMEVARPFSGDAPNQQTDSDTSQGAGEPQTEAAGGKGEKEKNDSPEPKVIRRDDKTRGVADPDELKAMVGEDGRVAFQFRNQPWVELVQWLADISDQPLDWLELPADRVNMRSPGRYTVEETRDLFNRYLLARGYTLLEIDGGLTVAKTEKINPAIVPRVDVAQLMSLPPHMFVRTSLDVGWLSAEKLAAELAPMISENGRLTALTTTNRIEAMDAAINLRQISQLLEQERSSASREALAPEFKLRHLPAEEAKRMLEEFLGVKSQKPVPMTPQQMQMMQQMRQQQQNQGMAVQADKKFEISIVANPRQNSVIIRAPADRVAIATEFLTRIDVPSESMVSLTDIESRVQVFRLASLDPEKLIEIVNEMNILEPTTRVRVDEDNNALIVSGSAADRYIIDSLIKRLDGSGRTFHVLPLRRLDAAEVAESIAFLMGQDKKDDKDSRGRSFYYPYFGGQEEEKKTDQFRVSANTRYRQVLLWANEQEMAEVESLLVKLGELPPPGGSRQTMRIIDASATPETWEYLQRLKQQWGRLSPNPLELPDADRFKDPNHAPEDDEAAEPPEPDSEPGVDNGNLAQRSDSDAYRLTLMQRPGGGDADDDPPAIRSSEDFDRAFGNNAGRESRRANQPPAPIRIELDSSGNLILVSPDTDALDQLENLMVQIAPPKRPYQVFHIKHASALWMRLNLEDYYEDMDEESEDDSFYRWYWDMQPQADNGPTGLGKGRKLRFIDDPDTNTLVVSGATNEQLRTIAELIKLWDVPEPVNKRRVRFTRLVPVQYGKADKIAETVKEAYRDLLSSNDKAFAGRAQGQQNRGAAGAEASKSRDGDGSGLQSSDSGRDGGGTDFSFKGKLSLGIDNVGNTILVSAEGEPLMELVADMINQLDEAARPKGEVQVIRLPGGISGKTLQNALKPFGVESSITPSRPARITNPEKPVGETE